VFIFIATCILLLRVYYCDLYSIVASDTLSPVFYCDLCVVPGFVRFAEDLGGHQCRRGAGSTGECREGKERKGRKGRRGKESRKGSTGKGKEEREGEEGMEGVRTQETERKRRAGQGRAGGE
jgi:hypothetical protein